MFCRFDEMQTGSTLAFAITVGSPEKTVVRTSKGLSGPTKLTLNFLTWLVGGVLFLIECGHSN